MLANNAAAMLRPGLVRSCGVQPILLRAATCPYSTSAAAPLISVRTKAVVSRKPLAARVAKLSTGPGPVTLSLAARRSASTTTAQKDAAASATASAQAQAAHPEVPPLDWNTFFQLRKTRRRWQLAFSIATCATGGLLGALALSTGVADPIVNQIPLDPFVTLGIMTFGFAALGWLAGPSLGSGVFYALKRQYKAQMILVSATFVCPQQRHQWLTFIAEGEPVLHAHQEEPC